MMAAPRGGPFPHVAIQRDEPDKLISGRPEASRLDFRSRNRYMSRLSGVAFLLERNQSETSGRAQSC
jgi:hypothetical protein